MQPISLMALFLQGVGFGLTAAVSPGPFQSFLITQTLSGGWKRGAPAAFAPLISDPPIIIAILLLLSQLPPNFIQVISLAGGLFVLYLAWGLWRKTSLPAQSSARTPDGDIAGPGTPEMGSGAEKRPANAPSSLLRGVLMNLLSPGPYTFWSLVLGPILLNALRQSPAHGAAFLVGFYSTLVGGMLGIVALFHQARRLGPRLVYALTRLSIAILVLFGILLVGRGLLSR
jgi:threonine/homoserine/homoserine lactone efflux protein